MQVKGEHDQLCSSQRAVLPQGHDELLEVDLITSIHIEDREDPFREAISLQIQVVEHLPELYRPRAILVDLQELLVEACHVVLLQPQTLEGRP